VLGSHTVFSGTEDTYRFRAREPIAHVRFSVTGDGKIELRFVALSAGAPGETIPERHRRFRLEELAGERARLVDPSGHVVHVPAGLLLRARAGMPSGVHSPSGGVLCASGLDPLIYHAPASIHTGQLTVELHEDPRASCDPRRLRDPAIASWIDGAGARAALARSPVAHTVDSILDPYLEIAALLRSDGRVLLRESRPRLPIASYPEPRPVPEDGRSMFRGPGGTWGFLLTVDDLSDLERIADAAHAAVDAKLLGPSPIRGGLAPARCPWSANPFFMSVTRSRAGRKELERFLRQDVLPRFRAHAAAGPPRAGEQFALCWTPAIRYSPENLEVVLQAERTVTVRRVDVFGASIVQGPDRSTEELELPRELLPAAPAPRIGDFFALYRMRGQE
jgi:hypothetical protein